MLHYWPWLLLVGFIGGTAGATLGIGAGTVFVPSLVLLFALEQKSAQGIALCVMVPMAAAGAFRYWLDPEIDLDLRLALVLASTAVIGANLGYLIAASLPAWLLRKLFGGFIVLVGLRMLLWGSGK